MNKYLLDTHVFLWMMQSPDNLSAFAESILESENKLFLSHASIWEMAIKIKIQKLNVGVLLSDFVDLSIAKHRLELFPISVPHIYYTQELPLHHRDPFDRLLIAQSIFENMPIVSADDIFDSYGIQRIWQ